ncbi:hypothetical protein AB1L88_05290 [Tautonia sp. JC769]|uniref:hypothetical protein n=1 Tax=Tautonia sp. JC769 TaxID=3232135 RepID=UPI003459E4B0
MLKLDESDERRAILAPGFRLSFTWTGDRWAHSLDVAHDAQFRQIATSLEGEADEGRIVSPALQQLQFQQAHEHPEILQALLVGLSGAHHFSVVFTVQETRDLICVSVEVADRCRLDLQALASTYAVDLPSSQIVEADTAGVSWSLPSSPNAPLRFESVAPARTDLREAGRRGCQIQACPAVVSGLSTHCWAYRWVFRTSH